MGRTRKDVLTEFRTATILQAAHRIFAKRGFDRATIAEIASAAGVAKGTVYLYYRSKREVYRATLERGLVMLHEETTRQLEAADTIGQKVHAVIATKLRHFEEHRDFFRIYASELGRSATGHTRLRRRLDELFLGQVRLLEQELRQAMRRRLVRRLRPEAAAFAVLDLTRGVVAQRLRGWSRAPLDQDIASTFDFVWKGLAPR